MFKELDEFLLFKIIQFLPNEIYLKLKNINFFNSLLNYDYVINYFKYRKHPITLNLKNMYCFKCNIGYFRLSSDKKLDTIHCKCI